MLYILHYRRVRRAGGLPPPVMPVLEEISGKTCAAPAAAPRPCPPPSLTLYCRVCSPPNETRFVPAPVPDPASFPNTLPSPANAFSAPVPACFPPT
jgi:hypothetical protein